MQKEIIAESERRRNERLEMLASFKSNAEKFRQLMQKI
jgi:hypothetical protein